MSEKEKLKNIIRELIKQELQEYSGTAAVAGYNTPNAFLPPKDFKKKHKTTKF